MSIYVFYHKSCMDGTGAAWAAWRKYGDTARYYAKNHGDDVGHVDANSEIYIVDYTFRRDVLLKLVADGHKVTVLDHHKSAMEDLADLPFATFDMTKSGARMSWEYFHPDKPVPKLILAVEDGDLWKWQYPDSKAIRALLGTFEWSWEAWSKFSDELDADPSLVKSGEILIKYQNRFAKSQAKRAALISVAGYNVRCTNATSMISEIGNLMLELFPDSPFSASFFVTDKGEYSYSLRSRGDFDVSEVARKYGGGGHASASGFRSDRLLSLEVV